MAETEAAPRSMSAIRSFDPLVASWCGSAIERWGLAAASLKSDVIE